MKSTQLFRALLPCLLVLALSVPATAAITLYDKEDTTFTVDAFFNAFYVNSEQDSTGHKQARVKMGFLPNFIGFNFSKQVGNLKMGGRSSFWVSINDSDDSPTGTAIDIRQFYGTVDADWGQVLIGKDFGLFSRSNIFLDEILLGFGKTAGLDASGVSFGNIGSGYTYPLPSAQITYRTPELSGFKLAVGIVDPSSEAGTDAATEENNPRLEAEATYNYSFDRGSVTAWLGGLTQTSKSAAGDVDSNGVSYGFNGKFAGASFTASGFTGEGLGVLGAVGGGANANTDSTGYLVQGSYTIDKFRLVASYGKTEYDTLLSQEDETIIGAVFYSINDNLKLVLDYNVETFTDGTGTPEDEIKTLALGASINF